MGKARWLGIWSGDRAAEGIWQAIVVSFLVYVLPSAFTWTAAFGFLKRYGASMITALCGAAALVIPVIALLRLIRSNARILALLSDAQQDNHISSATIDSGFPWSKVEPRPMVIIYKPIGSGLTKDELGGAGQKTRIAIGEVEILVDETRVADCGSKISREYGTQNPVIRMNSGIEVEIRGWTIEQLSKARKDVRIPILLAEENAARQLAQE